MIQLDVMYMSSRMEYIVQLYNEQSSNYTIKLLPTGVFVTITEPSFTNATLPVDGRWSDFASTDEAEVVDYLTFGRTLETMLLFYRKDVFKAYNVSVPTTWDQVGQAQRCSI
jgi:hypothetical protein